MSGTEGCHKNTRGPLRPVRYSFAELPLSVFCARYQHREKYLEFCKACERYGKCWACPPLLFDVGEYLRPFRFIDVVAAQIFFDEGEQKHPYSAQQLRDISWAALSAQKLVLFNGLTACERAILGSVQLASGGCHICERCLRADSRPCRCPERLRYSLDSFGFDLTAITEDMLGIKLLWCRDSLPEYYTLVHALLCRESELDRVKEFFEAR